MGSDETYGLSCLVKFDLTPLIKDFLSCLSEKEIVYDDYMEGEVNHFGDSKGHVVKHS